MKLLKQVVVTAALILVIDGCYAALRLVSEMNRAASAIEQGTDALEAADFAGAAQSFDDARAHARVAERMTGHASFELMGHLPLIGPDIAAVDSLVAAANTGAGAGVMALNGIEAIDPTDEGIAGAIYQAGRVDLAAFDVARPYVEGASELLVEARRQVAGAPSGNIPQLSAAVDDAGRRLDAVIVAADKGVRVLGELPRLLGAEQPRRYFLALQSPSEVRGSGGLIGFYGILEADDGKLRIAHLAPITELSDEGARRVEAPGWYARLYGPVGALDEWQQVNASINFPAVAGVILDRYEMVKGERLDGVIAMDPVALGQMTKGTGAVDGGVLGQIDDSNVREVLLRDVYTRFEDRPKAQNEVLRSIVEEFWANLGSGDIDVGGFSDGLGEAVDTGHIKIFSTDAATEEAMVDFSVDGGYQDETSNVQAVFNNNSSANKIDYYLHRTLETHVAIDDDGVATITTTAVLANHAPEGQGGLMSGAFIEGQTDGVNTMSLYFVMPEGSTPLAMTMDGRDHTPYFGRDDGAPVAWALVRVPAGETRQVAITYRLRDGIIDGRFPFTLFPQTTVNRDTFMLTAEGPDGRLLEVSEVAAEIGPPEKIVRGLLDRERRFRIEL